MSSVRNSLLLSLKLYSVVGRTTPVRDVLERFNKFINECMRLCFCWDVERGKLKKTFSSKISVLRNIYIEILTTNLPMHVFVDRRRNVKNIFKYLYQYETFLFISKLFYWPADEVMKINQHKYLCMKAMTTSNTL